jgi:hypothetical protein
MSPRCQGPRLTSANCCGAAANARWSARSGPTTSRPRPHARVRVRVHTASRPSSKDRPPSVQTRTPAFVNLRVDKEGRWAPHQASCNALATRRLTIRITRMASSSASLGVRGGAAIPHSYPQTVHREKPCNASAVETISDVAGGSRALGRHCSTESLRQVDFAFQVGVIAVVQSNSECHK